MIMNVPHPAVCMTVAGIVSVVSIAAAATVEIVKTRTERPAEIRRRETRNELAKRVDDPAYALLLDTLDETMTADRPDAAADQATFTRLLDLLPRREDPHQVTGSPSVVIGNQETDRPAGAGSSEIEPSDTAGEGLRAGGTLRVRGS